MKYDCTKTLDYQHEFNRMCEETFNKVDFCKNCELDTKDCTNEITEEIIAIVQKWSDEHSEITNYDKLKSMFPRFRKSFLVCPTLFDSEHPCELKELYSVDCKKCFEDFLNAPYKGLED